MINPELSCFRADMSSVMFVVNFHVWFSAQQLNLLNMTVKRGSVLGRSRRSHGEHSR